MNELQIQHEVALSASNITYLPDIPSNALAEIKHETVSLSSIGALGSSFSALAAELGKTAAQTGGSGLYYVNTMGKEMMAFKNGSGFLGSLKTAGGAVGGGQAKIIPACVNPTTLLMSAALVGISHKMDKIYALQQDIMDYLKQKDLAKIIGNINTLNDVSNNFCYNWNNECYKLNKHNLVQTIKKEAEVSINLNRSQINKALNSHKPKLYDMLITDFSGYQLSLYLFAFSSYLEVLLLGNFSADYLDSVVASINEHVFAWRTLYTDCYNKLEETKTGSIPSLLTDKASKLARNTGKKVANVPIISKTALSKAFVSGGEKLETYHEKLINKPLANLIERSTDCTHTFVENIDHIKLIFFENPEIMFDTENLYVLETG